MKLILENFKTHKSLNLEIPNSGLIRLDGPSGRGKSTIPLAIKFALKGGERGIKNWGHKKTKTSVSLLGFLGMDIVRTNTPNTLTVTHNDTEYKDDAAQGVIDDVLGMNENEFMVSSYIQQEAKNSILNEDPAKKSEIIQGLISKDDDINKVKEVIDEKIKLTKSELETENKQLEQLVSLKEDLYRRAPNNYEQPPQEPAKPKLFTEEIDELEKTINERSELFDKFSRNASRHEEKTKELDGLIKRCDDIEMRLQETSGFSPGKPWDSVSKEDSETKRDLYIKKGNYFAKFNEIVMLAKNIHESYPEAASHDGKLSDWMKNKITQEENDLGELNQKAGDLGSKIKDLKNWDEHMDCPDCRSKLKVYEGKLVHAKQKPEDYDDKLKYLGEKLARVMTDAEKKSDSIAYLKNALNSAAAMKEQLGKDPDPSIDSPEKLDDLVNELNVYMKKQMALEKEHQAYEISIAGELATQKEIQSRIDLLKKELDEIELYDGDLSELDVTEDRQRAQDTKDYLTCVKIYEMEKQRSESFFEQAKGLEDRINSLRVDELAGKLAALERIKEKTAFAAAASMEHKIQEMNISAEEHIDRMFDEDGTVIRLTSTKTISSGEERAKIDTEIFHKGEEVGKFSELSGGEKSRGCLAYQLGLGDLYNSPILMVDEGLPGLPPEKKEVCLEILREVSENKLILVIEHGVRDSFFDEVISV